jgi:hypothetical protein
LSPLLPLGVSIERFSRIRQKGIQIHPPKYL